MKKFLLIALFLFQSTCFALDVQFVGPCTEKPFYSARIQSTALADVGSLTIAILQAAKIPFQGTEQGLNQIFNSPIGQAAMEVVSDQEMMAYGWCFEVDGKVGEVLANEVSLNGVRSIRWFYGYAHYLKGKWVAQCLKSYRRRSPFMCHR